MGVLIVIDGVDASGKETQTRLLNEKLIHAGYNVKRISFPSYDKPWITPVTMYLGGDFGKNAEDVGAYTASMFFAMDRFASFITDWKDFYEDGGIIICDRYVSSNMIHQASKINNESERINFLSWIDDLEHNKNGLPRPDVTLFLDMPTEYGASLMAERRNKIDGSDVKDIHERDKQYLKKSYDNALFVATHFGWDRILCVSGENIRSIEDISEELFSKAKKAIEGKE